MTAQNSTTSFAGFKKPETNFFKVPHSFWDIDDLTVHERFVLLYILRHTWGYHEFGIYKRITIDEFQNGRKERDGTRMDKGCGVSRGAISNALCRLEELGYISIEVDSSDPARIKKSYTLNMLQDSVHQMNAEFTGRTQSSSDDNRTEKETKERNLKKETKKDSSPSVEDAPQQSNEEIDTSQNTGVEVDETPESPNTDSPMTEAQSQEPDKAIVQEKETSEVVEEPEEVPPKRDIADVAEEHLLEVDKKKPQRKLKPYQEVVRRALAEPGKPLKPGGYVGRYIKFFKGTYTSGEEALKHQLADNPMKPSEIIGLALWYRPTYARDTIPTNFEKLRIRCDEFNALPDRDKYVKEGEKRLDAILNGHEDTDSIKRYGSDGPTRESHRIVTAPEKDEISPEERAAAIAVMEKAKANFAKRPKFQPPLAIGAKP